MTSQIFTEFLTFLFRERAAGAYIRAGLYKATVIPHRHRQRAVLDAKSWTSLVTPGTTIDLALSAQRRYTGYGLIPAPVLAAVAQAVWTCGRYRDSGELSSTFLITSSNCSSSTRCRNFISFSSPSSLIRHEEPSMLLADTNDWHFVRLFCYEVHVEDSPSKLQPVLRGSVPHPNIVASARELYLQEALQYLNNMRDTVDAWTYQQFLDMVSTFHKQLCVNLLLVATALTSGLLVASTTKRCSNVSTSFSARALGSLISFASSCHRDAA